MSLSPTASAYLQLATWLAAFWIVVLGYRSRGGADLAAERLVAGLVLGALFAHLGDALMNLGQSLPGPGLAVDPVRGASVLFVPLGLLFAATWQTTPEVRQAFLRATLPRLPLALATARLGCLAAGCCGGTSTTLPWGLTASATDITAHPTPLYEIALLTALHASVSRCPPLYSTPLVLGGLGCVRLLVEPFRLSAQAGTSPAAWVAVAWLVIALLSAARACARTHRETEARRLTQAPR